MILKLMFFIVVIDVNPPFSFSMIFLGELLFIFLNSGTVKLKRLALIPK
jgi:hypothetical protein